MTSDLYGFLADSGLISEATAKAGRQQERNLNWLNNGSPIWTTGVAGVGICSGRDDFLVFTDLQSKSGVRIPATDVVIADFYAKVMPAILHHRQVSSAFLSQHWENGVNHLLQSVVPAVVEGRVTGRRAKEANMNGVKSASARVVAELEAFVKRHDASPLD